jgi:Spy/CpxP family protein refolding chaperone
LFCCGVALGVLANRYYDTEVVSAKAPSQSFRQRYVSHMRKCLDLTDAQVAQLRTIMDQTKERDHALREKYHPEVAQIRQEEIDNVKSILTASQVPIYEKMVKEHQEHERQKREKERKQQGGH